MKIIQSKAANKKYQDGWDRIFGKTKCLKCKGTGTVLDADVESKDMFFIALACPYCNGEGKVSKNG